MRTFNLVEITIMVSLHVTYLIPAMWKTVISSCRTNDGSRGFIEGRRRELKCKRAAAHMCIYIYDAYIYIYIFICNVARPDRLLGEEVFALA